MKVILFVILSLFLFNCEKTQKEVVSTMKEKTDSVPKAKETVKNLNESLKIEEQKVDTKE